jgi:uncharacterized protein YecE (DUF72 family)
MRLYVGTSGWSYDWNKGRSLEWFVNNSGLPAIELNGSFYRFPSESTVAGWAESGKSLRWSVKVHRGVSHNHNFDREAFAIWERFFKRFSSLDTLVEFYLFQAPPHFSDTGRLAGFADDAGIGSRFALEIRDPVLLGDDEACRRLQSHATLVSVDSPDFEERIFPGEIIYLRMHGRGKRWYFYMYSDDELRGILKQLDAANPREAYVFFNNDHAMLENACRLLNLWAGE